jgi:uncharacterized protein
MRLHSLDINWVPLHDSRDTVTNAQSFFAWHDLLTHKISSAKKFYAKVLGWTYVVEPEDYHLMMVDDCAVGGIMTAPEYLQKIPPFWSTYLRTDNVDAACRRASDLGGLIFRAPWDIPGIIRMAVIADPSGAIFNVLQPLNTDAHERPREGAAGTVGWHDVQTLDLALAWDFYAAMFGWTKGACMDLDAEGSYQIFQIDGQDAGGLKLKQAGLTRPMWLNYFNVKSMDAAVARILKAGGKMISDPQQVPGGKWVASAFDPQGASFHLMSAKR